MRSSSKLAWWEVTLKVNLLGRFEAEALQVKRAGWSLVSSSGPSIDSLSGGTEKVQKSF